LKIEWVDGLPATLSIRAMLDAKAWSIPLSIRAFNPPAISDDEGQIIARLGWAVMRSWGSLPANIQQQLREQAVFVTSGNSVQLNEKINAFIKEYGKFL
jgi:hypothetical protein